MKNVLITGVSGFIGPHLVKACLKRGWDVLGLDRRPCNFVSPRFRFVQMDVRSLMPTHLAGVDYVFHLAFVTNIPNSIQDPLGTTEDNLKMSVHLMDAAAKAKVKKFLFASTASLYGSNPVPWREEMAPQPGEPYSWQKLSIEYACRVWSERYGLPTVCFRFFQVFGEGQRPDTALAKFFAFKREGKPITLTETTAQSSFRTAQRDFIYVGDLAEACARGAESEKTGKGELINVASGTVYTMEDIASAIGAPVVFIPRRSFEVERHEADLTRTRELLDGWRAETDVIRWIKEGEYANE